MLRHEMHDAAAWPERIAGLFDHPSVVLDVLQNVEGGDEVEGLAKEANPLRQDGSGSAARQSLLLATFRPSIDVSVA